MTIKPPNQEEFQKLADFICETFLKKEGMEETVDILSRSGISIIKNYQFEGHGGPHDWYTIVFPSSETMLLIAPDEQYKDWIVLHNSAEKFFGEHF